MSHMQDATDIRTSFNNTQGSQGSIIAQLRQNMLYWVCIKFPWESYLKICLQLPKF